MTTHRRGRWGLNGLVNLQGNAGCWRGRRSEAHGWRLDARHIPAHLRPAGARSLDKVGREADGKERGQQERGPDGGFLTIDVHSTICETHAFEGRAQCSGTPT